MPARAATAFEGFPREALEFLRDLEADNDRDWFKANRARYDEFLVEPARALAVDLADLGSPHLFRPRRLIVFRRHDLRAWLHTPEAGARIREGLDAAKPLVRWLHEQVGPSQQQRR